MVALPSIIDLFTLIFIGSIVWYFIKKNKKDREESLEKSTPKSSKVRFCSACGAPLEESDRFCPVCGAKVANNDSKKKFPTKRRPK